MLYCSMNLGSTKQFELKMNGNTTDLLDKPMEYGVNIAFPELPLVSWDACANIVSASKAKQSKAKQSKAKQSKAKQSTPQGGAKQCSATREHVPSCVRERKPRTTAIQALLGTPQGGAKQCSATREHGKDRFRLTYSLPVISRRALESYLLTSPWNEASRLRSGFVFLCRHFIPENDWTDRK